MNLSPDPNSIAIGEELRIQARASDLDGITDVWAVINATYSPPVFSGDPERPIVDLPRIDLHSISEGVYEGTYTGFTYTGPYSLLVFACDTKGNVSLPGTCSLNVSGEEKTKALLIGGWDKGLYDLSTLLSHARWVLREKRGSRIKQLKEPALEEIENTLDTFDPDNTNQLFVYLVGPAEWDADQGLLFNLNPSETLSADMLDTLLDPFSSSPQVVLIDTPGAGEFFRESPNRIYIWSVSSNQPAYLEQGGFCAFSHFFFTCLYWGGKCIPGIPGLIRGHPVLFKSNTRSF